MMQADRRIEQIFKQDERCQRLAQVEGISPLIATAFLAAVGDATVFHTARQVAAWLGLVPRQYSSGGKARLLGISKRGDCYLRTLLIHGARAVIRVSDRKIEQADGWLTRIVARRNKNVATVALAHKNARIVWALLAHDRKFQLNYKPAVA